MGSNFYNFKNASGFITLLNAWPLKQKKKKKNKKNKKKKISQTGRNAERKTTPERRTGGREVSYLVLHLNLLRLASFSISCSLLWFTTSFSRSLFILINEYEGRNEVMVEKKEFFYWLNALHDGSFCWFFTHLIPCDFAVFLKILFLFAKCSF